jgi:glycosyltransferase involved in cell wall biosynthesis
MRSVLEMPEIRRIAIVVQRYGAEIIGGAESHARILAEGLQSHLGYDVSVLTSTAMDHLTWSNAYPEGSSSLNGVSILRFKVQPKKRWLFRFQTVLFRSYIFISRFLLGCLPLYGLERRWFKLQGPEMPGLLEYLEKTSHQYDAVIFFSYLYYPTVFGRFRTGARCLLIPTAHDEFPFYARSVRRLLDSVDCIFANSPAELKLIGKVSESARSKTKIVGIPVQGYEAESQDSVEDLIQNSFLLYLGRISEAKGIPELLSHWEKIRGHFPKLKLVLAGRLDDGFSLNLSRPDVMFLGQVSEARKAWLLSHCFAVVNPSQFESLSLLVLEGIAAAKPVLVNGRCAVFQDYAQEFSSVMPFVNAKQFKDRVTQILTHPPCASSLQEYRQTVENRYSWDVVLRQFKEFIEGDRRLEI